MRIKISACTIVKNEANNLPTWLTAMTKVADEIVVVDTGSTDNSKLIAQQAGAMVYDFAWCNDFAKAKNYAIERATGDWILFLDADEYFSEQSLGKLPGYLAGLPRQVAAVLCKLVNIDNHDEEQIMSSVLLNRIFRRIPSNRYVGKIHEKLVNTAGKYQIAYNHELLIFHKGYDRTMMEGKARRNLQILQEQEKTETDSQARRLLMGYLMDAYFGVGDYEKAIEYAHKAIASKMIPLGMAGHYEEVLFMAMQQAGYPLEETERVLQDAIHTYPEEPLFPLHLGHLYFTVQKYQSSVQYLWQGLVLREKLEKRLTAGHLLNDASSRLVKLAKDELGAMEQLQREKLAFYSQELSRLTGQRVIMQRYELVKECAQEYPYLPEWQAEYGETAGAIYFFEEAVAAYQLAIKCMAELPEKDKWQLSALSRGDLPQLQQRLAYWQDLRDSAAKMMISACLITRNEAEDLRDWLVNAAAYATEIVVADTGSTDNSLEVLAEFQQHSAVSVKILHFTWIDDFSAAKNYVLDHASCPWITFLDTDETFLYPECVPAMLAAAQKENKNVNSLMLHMFHVNKDKDDTILGQSVLVRVFKNQASLRYHNAVHENLIDSSTQDGQLNILTVPEWMSIRHTGYSTSSTMKKGDRNLRLLEQEIAKNGEGPGYYLYLVDSYEGAKDYVKALHYALKAIEAGVYAVGAESDMYARVLANMERLNYPKNEWDAFLEYALKEDPNNAYFHMAHANRLIEQGNCEQGISELKQVFILLTRPEGNRTSLSAHDIEYNTYVCLARGYMAIQNRQEAKISYLQSLSYYPRSGESLTGLYSIVISEGGSFPEYLQHIEQYLTCNQNNLAWLCRTMDEAGLEEAYLQTAKILQNKFHFQDAVLDLYEHKVWQTEQANTVTEQCLLEVILAIFALPIQNDLRQDCLRKLPEHAQELVGCFDGKIAWSDLQDEGRILFRKLEPYINKSNLWFIKERCIAMASSEISFVLDEDVVDAEGIELLLDALGYDKYAQPMLKRLLYYLQVHMEAVEIIGFLNQLYDKNKDAQFLAEALESVMLNQVYLYYGNLAGYSNQTYAMSWAAGRYDLALSISTARYQCMVRHQSKTSEG